MNYDWATGWLGGEPHRGLAARFTMMNAERLMVGIQGLGVAGAAYQQASAYARERLQGRSVDGMRGPVAIIEHADVRRMLLNIRAFVERSEEHTSELQSLMRISYAVFCLKKKRYTIHNKTYSYCHISITFCCQQASANTMSKLLIIHT